MGSLWFQNMIGCGLSEDELSNIPNPKLELLLHVGHRAIQTTSLLGGFIIAPFVTLIKGPRNLTSFARRSASYATYGIAPGAILGPVMMYCRMKNSSIEGYYDRCYRIRHNRNQVRVDRLSYAGMVTGCIVGFSTNGNPLKLATIGMLTGTAMAAVYNSPIIQKYLQS